MELNEVTIMSEVPFYMDGIHKQNLDTAKHVVEKDWDMIFCYDGPEGSGKSTKAIQDAYYCDSTINIDRIVFTPNEFRKAVLSAKKYEAVVYDEAYTGLSSRATMSLINRTLVSMLAEIRQRNLFIFVVMPTFFDLDKYVAIWRSRALVHIYTGKNFERGFFAFYNVDKKKDLYIQGKKFYSYANPSPNFIGRFTSHMPIDEVQYRKKKKDSLLDREKKAAEQQIKREIEDALFIRVMEITANISHNVKMEILNLPSSTYFYKLKKYEEMKDFS